MNGERDRTSALVGLVIRLAVVVHPVFILLKPHTLADTSTDPPTLLPQSPSRDAMLQPIDSSLLHSGYLLQNLAGNRTACAFSSAMRMSIDAQL